ncbi:MAG: SpoVA/SpoVAEb family sporulation membrane protein [Ruminococcaceae bacterium]|nr:SpoVA/SpoVAEb family sporulation membrane protein [Oscillospiraceae bacterium]
MNLDAKTYQKYVKAYAQKSPSLKNCFAAFVVGGSICLLAEGLYRLYLHLGVAEASVRVLTPVSIIVLTAIATGFGVFDCLAKFAGAGTLVPISGFANAVTSPAIDNKAEGLVMGVGAKMFIIAGPVIVYGTLASVIWGVIYYFLHGRGIV